MPTPPNAVEAQRKPHRSVTTTNRDLVPCAGRADRSGEEEASTASTIQDHANDAVANDAPADGGETNDAALGTDAGTYASAHPWVDADSDAKALYTTCHQHPPARRRRRPAHGLR